MSSQMNNRHAEAKSVNAHFFEVGNSPLSRFSQISLFLSLFAPAGRYPQFSKAETQIFNPKNLQLGIQVVQSKAEAAVNIPSHLLYSHLYPKFLLGAVEIKAQSSPIRVV